MNLVTVQARQRRDTAPCRRARHHSGRRAGTLRPAVARSATAHHLAERAAVCPLYDGGGARAVKHGRAAVGEDADSVAVGGGWAGDAAIDLVATEEPMEIRLRSGTRMQPVTVTMRTPGADFELAAGLLFAEGIVTGRAQLSRIEYCVDCEGSAAQQYNIVTAVTAPGSTVRFLHPRANLWDDVGLWVVRPGADRRDRTAGGRAGPVRAHRFA